jgi:hypothetical protein
MTTAVKRRSRIRHEQLVVRLNQLEREKIDRIAAKFQVTPSELIRDWIKAAKDE